LREKEQYYEVLFNQARMLNTTTRRKGTLARRVKKWLEIANKYYIIMQI
jgi:hypothetical protein